LTKNIKGLLHALQQSINEAILESHDVAAAMAALKRTGKCPVFTIDISMQDPPASEHDLAEDPVDEMDTLIAPPAPSMSSVDTAIARPPRSTPSEELVLSDADVEFLTALGISDPSWCHSTVKTTGD
jgi:hypothetical protein